MSIGREDGKSSIVTKTWTEFKHDNTVQHREPTRGTLPHFYVIWREGEREGERRDQLSHANHAAHANQNIRHYHHCQVSLYMVGMDWTGLDWNGMD